MSILLDAPYLVFVLQMWPSMQVLLVILILASPSTAVWA